VALSEVSTVAPVLEARQQLSKVLARFRAEGGQSAPFILGSHRAPEAVLMPYAGYRELLSEVEELRAFRARYEADVEALASVRLEGQEPSAFGHALAAQVILGDISTQDAIDQLKQHYSHKA
jgi:hypothetical protein